MAHNRGNGPMVTPLEVVRIEVVVVYRCVDDGRKKKAIIIIIIIFIILSCPFFNITSSFFY